MLSKVLVISLQPSGQHSHSYSLDVTESHFSTNLCGLDDRLEVESSWSLLINKSPVLLIDSSHDWFNLGGNDSFTRHWACVCDESHHSLYEYRYVRVTQHVHLILIGT